MATALIGHTISSEETIFNADNDLGGATVVSIRATSGDVEVNIPGLFKDTDWAG